jgi:hypothetical protein
MRARGLEKPLIMENLQRWYNADKNQTIQHEFEALLEDWKAPKAAGSGAVNAK